MNTSHFKYPRTPHLLYSPGATNDDKVLKDHSHFHGKEVVILEKMDGENSTLYNDYYHARSLDSAHHESRAWLKQFHSQFKHDIPESMRICGENMFAQHTIRYTELESYFYVFSIWNNVENECYDWDTTLMYAQLLDLTVVPQLWRGIFDDTTVQKVISTLNLDTQEGIVLRTVEGFKYSEFNTHVAKWVRRNHVNTDDHWLHQQVIPNLLRRTE